MRVLWVEDQIEDNRTFYDVLARRGSEIRLASTVQEAIVLISSETFDLVLVDLNIPIGTGEMVQRLEDSKYNGKHVVEAARAKLGERVRVVCLTSFWEDGRDELGSLGVEQIPKVAYLSEFERLIYGNS